MVVITQRCNAKKASCAVVGWVGMFSVWGVWVVRAVPPRTCAHGGSVGALEVRYPETEPSWLRTSARAVGKNAEAVKLLGMGSRVNYGVGKNP